MTEQTPIRLMLVDDHLLARLGVASMLNRQRDMKVVAEAGSGEEALARFPECGPDVVLLDLRLPGISGIECTAALRTMHPAAKVIVLTTFDGGENIYRAFRAGANAYLLKD